jgi:hypothetical protein
MCVWMYVCVYIYIYIYIYIYVCVCVCVCIYIYIFYWRLTKFSEHPHSCIYFISLLSDRISNLTDRLFIWWNITLLCVRIDLAYIKFWGPSLLYHIFQISVIKAEHWQQSSILFTFTFTFHCIVFCCLLETRNSVYKDLECINFGSLLHRLSSVCSWLYTACLRLL